MKRRSPFSPLTFAKSEEFLSNSCLPLTSAWVSRGNAEEGDSLGSPSAHLHSMENTVC